MKKLFLGVCLAAIMMVFGFSTSAFSYTSYEFYHLTYRAYNNPSQSDVLRFGFTIKNDDGSYPSSDSFHISYIGGDGETFEDEISHWGPYMESSADVGSNPEFSENMYYRTNLEMANFMNDNGTQVQIFPLSLFGEGDTIDDLDMRIPIFDSIPAYNGFDVNTLTWSSVTDGYNFSWDAITGGSDTTSYRLCLSGTDNTGMNYEVARILTKDDTSAFITNELLGDLTWSIHFEERLPNVDDGVDNLRWMRLYQEERAEFKGDYIPPSDDPDSKTPRSSGGGGGCFISTIF